MAKKKKVEISNDEAQKLVGSGAAVIPAEAVVENVELDQAKKDYENHPKFSKFKNVEGA